MAGIWERLRTHIISDTFSTVLSNLPLAEPFHGEHVCLSQHSWPWKCCVFTTVLFSRGPTMLPLCAAYWLLTVGDGTCSEWHAFYCEAENFLLSLSLAARCTFALSYIAHPPITHFLQTLFTDSSIFFISSPRVSRFSSQHHVERRRSEKFQLPMVVKRCMKCIPRQEKRRLDHVICK